MSRRCLRLVAVAAELAEARGAQLVVCSGRGEAEAMVAAWPAGADVELVAEPTARITAENAARTLPILLERGVREAIVVCGRTHAPRVRYLFGSLYARYGITCEVRSVGLGIHPGALVRECGAALVARRQRSAARAELEATLDG